MVLLFAVTCLTALPGVAMAQSALQGVVKDISGGVLSGVLVEASSDALIEGTRSATTDASGSFRIIDLRPGTYTVVFTLSGFQPLKVAEIVLPAEQTRTVNGELTLGTISEALTVSGVAPVVDVQNATRVTSLERAVLDNLPTGNNIWEMAQMVPGINVTDAVGRTTSSVGGSSGATQNYMSVHGMGAAQNVVMVDGMTVSGLEANGAVQAYFNNDMNAEVSYQTSGIGADRSGGGVTVNMIPREGGNRFSGNGKFSFRPRDWIADNSSRYSKMGLANNASLRYLSDVTGSEGGPIIRNKLWFFGSFHQFDTSDFVDNTFFDNGEQGADDQRIQQGSVRLTYQATPSNKVSGYYERTNKTRSNEMATGVDPETASSRWTSPHYGTGNVKLTSTITPRLLFEGGLSFNREHRDVGGQPGVQKEYGTADWLASATRTGGGMRGVAPTAFSQEHPSRDNFQGSVSYVTGDHQFKAGVQFQRGTFFHSTNANADLSQLYDAATLVNFNPVFSIHDEVTVRNTPVSSQDRLNADVGIYAQDSWRINRVTVNAGLRWEHINAQNDAWEAPEGRFVPRRSIPAVTDVPNWYDWAPRFSAVWDVFGNSRTAVKYAISRYNRSAGTALANGFNTLSSTTRTLDWVDKNGDDIAQGTRSFTYNANGTVTPLNCNFATDPTCEIDLAPLDVGGVFGTPQGASQYEGFPRTWNLEQLVEVQHALTRRLSIIGSFTRGVDHDLTKSVNTQIRDGDFVPVTIYNPIDGTPITIYNPKDAATRTRIRSGATSLLSYVEPGLESVFYQYAAEFRMRPYAGAQLFGGFSFEREDDVNCVTSVGGGIALDPNSLRFCDETNLPGNGLTDSGGAIPFAKDFRLGISLPLPWYGINLGMTYQNNDSGGIAPLYSLVPRAAGATVTRYPDGLVIAPTNPLDPRTGSASFNRLIAGRPAPACPTDFGCVPGDPVLPTTWLGTGVSTVSAFTVGLYPAGRVRRERQNQVDLKLSKTFRIGNASILPTVEVANLFNDDGIFGYSIVPNGATYGITSGVYMVPASTLQSRIIGVGAQVRW
jgi:hypothetical protein